jgi:DNA topoisomerase-1
MQMLDLEPSLKKKKGAAFFERDEDLDMEWIKEHQAYLMEEQTQKIKKKFEKDNEKRVAEGEKEMKASELDERLEVVKDMKDKFTKENKSGKVEAEGRGPTVEKLEAQITKLDQRVDTMSVQAQDKEDNKEVALGTSKIVSFFLLLQPRPSTNSL